MGVTSPFARAQGSPDAGQVGSHAGAHLHPPAGDATGWATAAGTRRRCTRLHRALHRTTTPCGSACMLDAGQGVGRMRPSSLAHPRARMALVGRCGWMVGSLGRDERTGSVWQGGRQSLGALELVLADWLGCPPACRTAARCGRRTRPNQVQGRCAFAECCIVESGCRTVQ